MARGRRDRKSEIEKKDRENKEEAKGLEKGKENKNTGRIERNIGNEEEE